MPLTKSEFDRWKAQADEAQAKLAAIPSTRSFAINTDGKLIAAGSVCRFDDEQTRALYEMLRAWYGEETMTATARAVVEAADAWESAPSGGYSISAAVRLSHALQSYRAEQKEQGA